MALDHSVALPLLPLEKKVRKTQHSEALILATAPGPVSALMAQQKSTSIVLTWSAPQEPNGVIISYEATYRVNDITIVTNTTASSTTFTISSLTPQTTVSKICLH